MKYNDLRGKIIGPVFSQQNLRLLGLKVFPYQFCLWQKQGHLIRLKNGLYAFKNQVQHLLPEEVSLLLYPPSYISLEKALSAYGILPEVVYGITGVTSRITRNFKNELGSFSYRHIKPSLLFGYQERKGLTYKYLIAEPEKALLDFLYLNLEKIKSTEDFSSFRFNSESLKKELSRQKLLEYLKQFKNPKMERILHAYF